MKTVLVLEDEPLIAMSIVDELENAGFSVATAMSCEEATSWLDANSPDAVVVDIVLRDGESCSVVSRLVDARIPFVVHSGDPADTHAGTPYETGLWVSKPSAGSDIVQALESLLVPA